MQHVVLHEFSRGEWAGKGRRGLCRGQISRLSPKREPTFYWPKEAGNALLRTNWRVSQSYLGEMGNSVGSVPTRDVFVCIVECLFLACRTVKRTDAPTAHFTDHTFIKVGLLRLAGR
jgi:hypothetical protein